MIQFMLSAKKKNEHVTATQFLITPRLKVSFNCRYKAPKREVRVALGLRRRDGGRLQRDQYEYSTG